MEEEAKTKARQEYRKRSRKILKSRLNAKHKIEAINMYAVPVIQYTAGVIKWTKEDMNKLNRQTRKMLTMYGALHPRADVDRLYLPRRIGGRGLKDMAETIEKEVRSLTEYVHKSQRDPLLEIVKAGGIYPETEEDPEAWQSRVQKEREDHWKEKALHGQYPRQMEEVTNCNARYHWLREGSLKIETEALLTAAQEQALNTKAHSTYIMKTSTDPKCRICGAADETVSHILTACTVLAGTQYLNRHNEVAKAIHWSICEAYGIEVATSYWKHEPPDVVETKEMKILWDFDMYTDRYIQARRPDIIIHEKLKKKATIIDIAVPEDRNIGKKEKEKIEKYQDLRLELRRLWKAKIEVVPVVIGALGAYSPKLENYLEAIPGEHSIPRLLKAALLGSAHILRRVLDLPETW
jgi:alkylhydroperoxidase/carboxymuconolactone decarboxylase family protein YurZ